MPDIKAVEIDLHAQLKSVPLHTLTDGQLMAIASQGLKCDAIEGEVVPIAKKLKAAT